MTCRKRIEALPANLVTAWIEIAAHRKGRPIETAVREMNADLGTQHQGYRIRKWRRGDEPIPDRVQAYMRSAILHDLFGPKTAEALAARILAEHTRIGQ